MGYMEASQPFGYNNNKNTNNNVQCKQKTEYNGTNINIFGLFQF